MLCHLMTLCGLKKEQQSPVSSVEVFNTLTFPDRQTSWVQLPRLWRPHRLRCACGHWLSSGHPIFLPQTPNSPEKKEESGTEQKNLLTPGNTCRTQGNNTLHIYRRSVPWHKVLLNSGASLKRWESGQSRALRVCSYLQDPQSQAILFLWRAGLIQECQLPSLGWPGRTQKDSDTHWTDKDFHSFTARIHEMGYHCKEKYGQKDWNAFR